MGHSAGAHLASAAVLLDDGPQTAVDGLVLVSGVYDIVQAIAVDSHGDIVVIGYGKGQNLGNIRLCKFSPEGDLRWGKDIDGGADDAGYGVAIMADDRIVACGRMSTENANGDAWLAVFSP